MGAPRPVSLPEKGSTFSSPGASIFSPSETESSVTDCASSSSSFTHSDSTHALAYIQSQSKQDITMQGLPEGIIVVAGLRNKDSTDVRNSHSCTCGNPRRGSKRALMGSCKSCKVRMSMRKACCRCAGAFAADCAALCCCPCAIISLLALVLVELPSALATRMITHFKKRLSVKGAAAHCGNRHEDEAHNMTTPTKSQRESSKGTGEAEAVHIIRFDTENLLKHFDAEHVGFGCLSQKRE